MRTKNLLKEPSNRLNVSTVVNHYEETFEQDISAADQQTNATLCEEYYSLVTDFYLHGWGKMFHFGVRRKGENLHHSLLRHEKFLCEKMELARDEKCLDIGCGVGGPMLNIAKWTGARITGINNNAYQIEKGRAFIEEANLSDRCNFLNCNWMEMPLPSASFDKAYAIEATCHAAHNRAQLFAEIHRVLKPGALFTGYDWTMTPRYNPQNLQHRKAKRQIEIGDAISDLTDITDVSAALQKAGFEVLHCYDRVPECDKETPWYLPLKGEGLSGLRTSPIGRDFMRYALRTLETLRMVPKGSAEVHKVLEQAADGLVAAGEMGIFSPMIFFLARKK